MTRFALLLAAVLAACAPPTDDVNLGVTNLTERRVGPVTFFVGETAVGEVPAVLPGESTTWTMVTVERPPEGTGYGAEVRLQGGRRERIDFGTARGPVDGWMHIRVRPTEISAEVPGASIVSVTPERRIGPPPPDSTVAPPAPATP